MKPTPTCSMQRAMASGGRLMLIPRLSSTSALPLLLETLRPPCLLTRAPAAARAPLNRAQLAAEIERLRPQIESYRQRIETLDADFDRELAAILTPEQQAIYAAAQKRRAERMAKGAAESAAKTAPLTDDEIDQLRQRSLFGVLWNVAPTMKQDALIKDLKITEAQRPKTLELLRQRREKFLAIVDSTPPP
eukprot:gene49719-60862_t